MPTPKASRQVPATVSGSILRLVGQLCVPSLAADSQGYSGRPRFLLNCVDDESFAPVYLQLTPDGRSGDGSIPLRHSYFRVDVIIVGAGPQDDNIIWDNMQVEVSIGEMLRDQTQGFRIEIQPSIYGDCQGPEFKAYVESPNAVCEFRPSDTQSLRFRVKTLPSVRIAQCFEFGLKLVSSHGQTHPHAETFITKVYLEEISGVATVRLERLCTGGSIMPSKVDQEVSASAASMWTEGSRVFTLKAEVVCPDPTMIYLRLDVFGSDNTRCPLRLIPGPYVP